LSGKNGAPGKEGAPGPPGMPGAHGMPGPKGLVGSVGNPGKNGVFVCVWLCVFVCVGEGRGCGQEAERQEVSLRAERQELSLRAEAPQEASLQKRVPRGLVSCLWLALLCSQRRDLVSCLWLPLLCCGKPCLLSLSQLVLCQQHIALTGKRALSCSLLFSRK